MMTTTVDGSADTSEGSADLRCPECGRRMVVLTFGSGLGHELRSCGFCDIREWVRDGEPLGRQAVLADVHAVRDLLPGRRFR